MKYYCMWICSYPCNQPDVFNREYSTVLLTVGLQQGKKVLYSPDHEKKRRVGDEGEQLQEVQNKHVTKTILACFRTNTEQWTNT